MFANFLEKRKFAKLHKTKLNKLFKLYKIKNKLIRKVFTRKMSKLQKNNPKNFHKDFFNTVILQLNTIQHINLAKNVNSFHKDLLKNIVLGSKSFTQNNRNRINTNIEMLQNTNRLKKAKRVTKTSKTPRTPRTPSRTPSRTLRTPSRTLRTPSRTLRTPSKTLRTMK
tara:strand:- start:133 stop:636 length:504 start_codon:yes stop_codon:yes gene_type:complete